MVIKMIIDGKTMALQQQQVLKEEVDILKEKYGRCPCLAVIMVGKDQASQVYVRNKERACKRVGIQLKTYLYENIEEEALISLIQALNEDHHIDGILIELPLPKYLSSERILKTIDSDKDVDGFHPNNIAHLFLNEPGLRPCTPEGMMVMLDEIGYSLEGKEVVVVGRSSIVGKPVALMALNKHATVTICHSRTKHLEEVCQRADVLIVAVGKAKFIKASYVKEGAVVLDVGINRDEHGQLCGDVDFEEVQKKASYITPVPGGVGALTVTMLMKNTIEAFKMKGESAWIID